MPIPRDLEFSRRRARDRERVLFALAEREVATVGELSKVTRVRPYRVHGILRGDGGEYAYDLALVAQGAAAFVPTYGAQTYAITSVGAREVERLLARRRDPPGEA